MTRIKPGVVSPDHRQDLTAPATTPTQSPPAFATPVARLADINGDSAGAMTAEEPSIPERILSWNERVTLAGGDIDAAAALLDEGDLLAEELAARVFTPDTNGSAQLDSEEAHRQGPQLSWILMGQQNLLRQLSDTDPALAQRMRQVDHRLQALDQAINNVGGNQNALLREAYAPAVEPGSPELAGDGAEGPPHPGKPAPPSPDDDPRITTLIDQLALAEIPPDAKDIIRDDPGITAQALATQRPLSIDERVASGLDPAQIPLDLRIAVRSRALSTDDKWRRAVADYAEETFASRIDDPAVAWNVPPRWRQESGRQSRIDGEIAAEAQLAAARRTFEGSADRIQSLRDREVLAGTDVFAVQLMAPEVEGRTFAIPLLDAASTEEFHRGYLGDVFGRAEGQLAAWSDSNERRLAVLDDRAEFADVASALRVQQEQLRGLADAVREAADSTRSDAFDSRQLCERFTAKAAQVFRIDQADSATLTAIATHTQQTIKQVNHLDSSVRSTSAAHLLPAVHELAASLGRHENPGVRDLAATVATGLVRRADGELNSELLGACDATQAELFRRLDRRVRDANDPQAWGTELRRSSSVGWNTFLAVVEMESPKNVGYFMARPAEFQPGPNGEEPAVFRLLDRTLAEGSNYSRQVFGEDQPRTYLSNTETVTYLRRVARAAPADFPEELARVCDGVTAALLRTTELDPDTRRGDFVRLKTLAALRDFSGEINAVETLTRLPLTKNAILEAAIRPRPRMASLTTSRDYFVREWAEPDPHLADLEKVTDAEKREQLLAERASWARGRGREAAQTWALVVGGFTEGLDARNEAVLASTQDRLPTGLSGSLRDLPVFVDDLTDTDDIRNFVDGVLGEKQRWLDLAARQLPDPAKLTEAARIERCRRELPHVPLPRAGAKEEIRAFLFRKLGGSGQGGRGPARPGKGPDNPQLEALIVSGLELYPDRAGELGRHPESWFNPPGTQGPEYPVAPSHSLEMRRR